MQSHRIATSLTYNADSNTVSWFVEHNTDAGPWELWSEGTSTPLNVSSDVHDALEALLMLMMAARSSSMSRSSR